MEEAVELGLGAAEAAEEVFSEVLGGGVVGEEGFADGEDLGGGR